MEINDYINELIEDVHHYQYVGDFDKALEVIEPLIGDIEDLNLPLEEKHLHGILFLFSVSMNLRKRTRQAEKKLTRSLSKSLHLHSNIVSNLEILQKDYENWVGFIPKKKCMMLQYVVMN